MVLARHTYHSRVAGREDSTEELSVRSRFLSLLKRIDRFTCRKAALCFSEVGMYDRADEAIRSCSGTSAKNDFVRFYNATLRVDEPQGRSSSWLGTHVAHHLSLQPLRRSNHWPPLRTSKSRCYFGQRKRPTNRISSLCSSLCWRLSSVRVRGSLRSSVSICWFW